MSIKVVEHFLEVVLIGKEPGTLLRQLFVKPTEFHNSTSLRKRVDSMLILLAT